MYSVYHILLQVNKTSATPGFVLRVGLLVLFLAFFIIAQFILSRWKNNRLASEKKLLQEQFDSHVMHSKIEIQEATFESLGTELHDNIGQLLSTAKMFIGITERNMEPPPITLISANETLDKAIQELRDLSKSLNKDWLQKFDLYRNLSAELARINSSGEINIKVKKINHVLPLGAEEQFIFYRILQEAIQNILKHSFAKMVNIDISYDENLIKSSVQDDGRGFDAAQDHTGLGIKIMKQRIKILKGSIKWESSFSGTKLLIQFPVKKL